jgi:hypothetical protein
MFSRVHNIAVQFRIDKDTVNMTNTMQHSRAHRALFDRADSLEKENRQVQGQMKKVKSDQVRMISIQVSRVTALLSVFSRAHFTVSEKLRTN